MAASRQQLIDAVVEATRENSTLAVFFHTAIAEQAGLGATDEKTLFILNREGPLTAGEIAQRTGLTTASVTSLIDRLEGKGFVRRVRDTEDRRRVIVELVAARMAEFFRLFEPIQDDFAALLASYSDGQLATIADFLARSSANSRALMQKIKEKK